MSITGGRPPSRRRQAGGVRSLAASLIGLVAVTAFFLQDRLGPPLVSDDPSLPPMLMTFAGAKERKALNLACNRGDMRSCRSIFGERFDAGRRKEALTLLAAMVKRLKGVIAGRSGENEDLIELRAAAEALLASKDDGSELSPAQRAALGLGANERIAADREQAERRRAESAGLNVLVRSAPGEVPPQLHVEQYRNELAVTSLSEHRLMVSITSFFPRRNGEGKVVALEGCYWGAPDSKKRGAEEYIVFAPREKRSLEFFAECGGAVGREPSSVPLRFAVYDYATKLWVFASRSQ